MNAARLLAHLGRVSEAPDAVPRLRRFILDLAVRGKLVEQDPSDEPASELLKRIQAEKARLVKAGEIKNERWMDTPANDGPRRPWGDIKNGYSHFADGDVGLAKITPCFENGKSTVFRGLTGGLGAGITELHVLRPVLIDAEYVLVFLKCPGFIEAGVPKMTGTAGQKRVPVEYFAGCRFPLPPLAEQQRIVAKVDELMALCDRLAAAQAERESRRDRLLVASLRRLSAPADGSDVREQVRFHLRHFPRLTTRPEHVQQLRQAVLNLAVCGRLVPQDPRDEPASELLKRITAEKARLAKQGKITPAKSRTAARAEDLAFELKPGWQPTRIGEVLLELQTGPFGSSLHQSDYQEGGTPVINPASIKNERLVPVERMAVGPQTLRRLDTFKLHAGDVVMARRGEMGRCAVVTEREHGWLCGTGSLILRAAEGIFPRFLVTVIGSPFVREYFGGSAVGATMQNLNQGILLNLAIGLPPLAEPRRIVAKVDELMALCDRLEAALAGAQTEGRRLLEALLHDALAPAA